MDWAIMGGSQVSWHLWIVDKATPRGWCHVSWVELCLMERGPPWARNQSGGLDTEALLKGQAGVCLQPLRARPDLGKL